MKRLLIALPGPILIALILTAGTVQAASFSTQEDSFQLELADWHSANHSADDTLYTASYSHSSLSEVVDGYWQALHALGYTGSLQGATTQSTTYSFSGTQGTLSATFTLVGEQIIATINRSETYA